MIVGRRTFIQGAALVATAPALASLLSLSSTAQSHASPLPGTLLPQLAADRTKMTFVLCKIDGWDRCEDIAIDGATIASADPVTHGAVSEQFFISINQSWRTAWR